MQLLDCEGKLQPQDSVFLVDVKVEVNTHGSLKPDTRLGLLEPGPGCRLSESVGNVARVAPSEPLLAGGCGAGAAAE